MGERADCRCSNRRGRLVHQVISKPLANIILSSKWCACLLLSEEWRTENFCKGVVGTNSKRMWVDYKIRFVFYSMRLFLLSGCILLLVVHSLTIAPMSLFFMPSALYSTHYKSRLYSWNIVCLFFNHLPYVANILKSQNSEYINSGNSQLVHIR